MIQLRNAVIAVMLGCTAAVPDVEQAAPVLSRAEFVQVDGAQLVYRGAPVRLKGSNLESFTRNTDTIWRDFDAYRDELRVLLDRARDFGANTIRLTFPDNSLRFDGDGSVRSSELDKVGRMLDDLGARGIGAILTVFNRHDYANADHARDGAKIASFARRFGQDPRVVLWDIVNEPTVANPDTRARVLGWLADMRGAFDAVGPVQPITIGNVGHWDADLSAPGLANSIGLSDVVSIHCYGRYLEGATPAFADGVAYRDDTFCGAVVQYLRDRTGKPILMEELGWPDAPSVQWPPSPMHPWRFHDFPVSQASADDLYAQVLGALDRKGAVGAIQWQLQDTVDAGWGLIDGAFRAKRAGVPGSVYERFRGWGGGAVRPFDFGAPGYAAGVLRDTSTLRVARPQYPGGDWDACRGKLDCADGEAVVGIATDVGDRHGHAGLCHALPGLTGQVAERLDLDGLVDRRRARRVVPGAGNDDWAPGFYKLECGAGEYVAGMSENANQCQRNNRFHAVLCARGPGGLGTCRLRTIDGTSDDRGTLAAGDWDRDHYKAECAADEFAVGISVHPGTFAPHTLLCCRP
jgi:hypothetical protein